MKRKKGVILLTVLLFISLFSLMSLYTLNMAALSHKNNRYDWEKMSMLIKAERLMSKIEIQSLSQCRLEPKITASNKPFSWWKKWGCVDKSADLECYHLVQALGPDHCAYIKPIDNQMMIAEYYRITLLCWTGDIQDLKLLLQSTVIKAGKSSRVCSSISRRVSVGRQTLREIYSS